MLADLVRTQAGLIDAAVALVAPGGTLIYCTCSLQPEEGERQVRAALGRHPQLQRWPIEASEIGGWSELLDPDGQIRSTPAHLPEIGGIDGFFVARLRLS
jgi:16S rRNA (cytosine967-C5)-methyltransferase